MLNLHSKVRKQRPHTEIGSGTGFTLALKHLLLLVILSVTFIIPAAAQDLILAVNWQPAFCETASGKPECRTQRPTSFEATNFTLHGLWPQPFGNDYCRVSRRDRERSRSGDWFDLPALDLPADLRSDLNRIMPGTQSVLDRHEWIRHGTCYGTDAQEFYADSLALMEALNASEAAALFASNIGGRLTLDQVRAAFDESFGSGAGDRVALDCTRDGNRTLIVELRISLSGTVTGPDDFADLLAAADPLDNDCAGGEVDAVGLR